MTLSKLNVAALVLGSTLSLGSALTPAFAANGDTPDNRLSAFLNSTGQKPVQAVAERPLVEGRQAVRVTAPSTVTDVDRYLEERNRNSDDR